MAAGAGEIGLFSTVVEVPAVIALEGAAAFTGLLSLIGKYSVRMSYVINNSDRKGVFSIYTTQNLLRITFSFNDLMLKANRLKKVFFYKDRLIFGLDYPVANMSIRHVYYA